MRFLCDVHIPFALVKSLIKSDFETIHVNELPHKWNTTDREICVFADSNDYVVITKDTDFRDSFFLSKTPRKLIKINLGNITNQELIQLFDTNIDKIKVLDDLPSFLLEIGEKDIILTSGDC